MSEKPDNYFTMYMGDYLRDTMHLTTRQHGAYQLLLMHYYSALRPLPTDEATIRAITKESIADWKIDGPLVMAYFTKKDDGWHQGRADKEIAGAKARYDRAVKGAAAKHAVKQPSSKAQADDKQVLNGCLNDANPHPPASQDVPTAQSCDSSARRASRRGGTAAPLAALGPGWEASFPKWAEFRQAIGAGAWGAWFSKARLNGSETSLIMDSEFALEQVRYRYSKQLQEHFGERVHFICQAKPNA